MDNNTLVKMINNMVSDIEAMSNPVSKLSLHNNFIKMCNDMREKEQLTEVQFNLCKETLSQAVVRKSLAK